jgi:periplasmic protein CpxP/Spy
MAYTTKRLALATVAAALVLAAGLAGVHAAAQNQNTNPAPPPFMGRGMGPGGPMGILPHLGRELGLSDSQRDQIKAIVASHRDEWKALGDRARTAHEALGAAVTGDTIDETLIRAKSADVAAVEADMAVARAHAHAEVMQILTADQKAKLKELRTQARTRMPRRGL